MAQDKKADKKAAKQPTAGSVDREPSAEPTPQAQGLPVDSDDEPKGHPTSERFQTEQAHPKDETDDEDQ